MSVKLDPMRKILYSLMIAMPLQVVAQNEVAPEGYKIFWFIAILIAIPFAYYFVSKFLKKSKPLKKGKPGSVSRRKLKVELIKDRKLRPHVLTLKVTNSSKKDIDLAAPVLVFRKLWTKRKFKLKGLNRYEIYPLYLESGKTHELRIDLSVFYNHDRKIKRFYWAKVKVFDTRGKKYSSGYITLRRSLFS